MQSMAVSPVKSPSCEEYGETSKSWEDWNVSIINLKQSFAVLYPGISLHKRLFCFFFEWVLHVNSANCITLAGELSRVNLAL